MDHSVAVCANKSKFIYMSLMSIGKWDFLKQA